MMDANVNPEQARYEHMWSVPAYRNVAPGEQHAVHFMARLQVPAGAAVIDFGCGTGRGGFALSNMGCVVTLLDFAENCLDAEVRAHLGERLRFVAADLLRVPADLAATYGFCCDVLEHIAEGDVRLALANILASVRYCYLSISTVPDHFGPAELGEPLHLTVRPPAWWREQLEALGAQIIWADEDEVSCTFHVACPWKDLQEVIKGDTNVPEAVVAAQIRENLAAGWQHAVPCDTQEREVVLLAGGPSMKALTAQIRELVAAGAALVTVNGAYNWALEFAGLRPGAQVVLDARKFNARFTKPVTEYTRYLIASQCHPATLVDLPRERTFLWHTGLSDELEDLIRQHNNGNCFPVPGGSTVVLRAIPLLRMLGFYKFHVFGFDSCLLGGEHHSYWQQENDGLPAVPVSCGGRVFWCHPWMLAQASEFRPFTKRFGANIELEVYGDGLIAHMIKTGASLSSEKE